MVDVLSYGGGQQTAGMLAMIKLGKLPKPDVIIFADTGDEMPDTYQHIEQYAKPIADELGIPFEIVRHTNKGKVETLYDFSWRYKWIPQPWGRTCTNQFKIQVIHKALRPYKGQQVNVWMGISTDEAQRKKESRVKWITNVFPLLERGFNRQDCTNALIEAEIPAPGKSSCFYCPFQKQTRWRTLQIHHPGLFQKAIDLEEHARTRSPQYTLTGKAPLKTYLAGEQLAWEELLEAEEGCHTGYCFV